ncbi:unnamed protein product [Soboliphyme baturini]|uniref:Methyltransf_21 domain-containing protein n=1 Tax=Soboliphyme baturini TaxID=241478 RepID=A0A183J6X7_9BILA|nr:unnamed protein product [Soboliphyme baturini]
MLLRSCWRSLRKIVRYPICALLCVCVLLLAFRAVIQRKPLFYSTYDDSLWDDDYIAKYDADDPRLLSHIYKYYLEPPAERRIAYCLDDVTKLDYSQYNQSTIVATLLKHKRNGFFVEAGAYDGEELSNSLYFEKSLNWTGLLVEPSKMNYAKLRCKKRKAWTLRGCLSGDPKPRKMKMIGAGDLGALDDYTEWWRMLPLQYERRIEVGTVWCFPLISVLMAINQTKIDYMVLDIERAEIPVLRSTPMDKIDVKVLQIEFSSYYDYAFGQKYVQKRKAELQNFMATHLPLYKEYETAVIDLIYVK